MCARRGVHGGAWKRRVSRTAVRVRSFSGATDLQSRAESRAQQSRVVSTVPMHQRGCTHSDGQMRIRSQSGAPQHLSHRGTAAERRGTRSSAALFHRAQRTCAPPSDDRAPLGVMAQRSADTPLAMQRDLTRQMTSTLVQWQAAVHRGVQSLTQRWLVIIIGCVWF